MKIFLRVSLALLLIITSGCHSYRPVDLKNSEIEKSVKVGDNVAIKCVDGTRVKFVIEKIENESLYGSHGEIIKYTDVATIKKSEQNTKKTVGLIGIIAGGVALGALTIYIFSHAK